jgi:hypothetical protein
LEKRGRLAGLWPAVARPRIVDHGDPEESLAQVV